MRAKERPVSPSFTSLCCSEYVFQSAIQHRALVHYLLRHVLWYKPRNVKQLLRAGETLMM